MSKVRSIRREIEKKAEREAQAELPSKVTLTLGELVDSAFGLSTLSNQPSLSAALNFHIGKLLRLANLEIEEYEKVRKAVCEKYGEEVKGESRYDIKPESLDAFSSELEELRKSSLTLAISPIRLDALEKAQGLTGAMMMVLNWLIVE